MKRAEQQGETRRRIVEAAVELHGTVGPARTTVAQVAKLAGVQRHTYYAHFPDDRDLMLACSGLTMERDPLPEPDRWAALPAGRARLSEGLCQIYGWYQRNQDLAACVLRDAEFHPLTQEIVGLRMAPTFKQAEAMLAGDLGERSRSLLKVGLEFACWKALSALHDPAAAATLMADAICSLEPGR